MENLEDKFIYMIELEGGANIIVQSGNEHEATELKNKIFQQDVNNPNEVTFKKKLISFKNFNKSIIHHILGE